eukprot:CAMPEP_0194146306 /NCGR_PEP_ID=MMETSP0152-20130528/20512_1 /TAXON_ID=1049557 /ORGANISM="Thalassiothrix antarctica, Strain L6-D1" /LENGTH=87 /DNA_ID=CAMNT_0038846791 /DNA_START=263 /DNA_END=526 /DNA_ORIENTATION=-
MTGLVVATAGTLPKVAEAAPVDKTKSPRAAKFRGGSKATTDTHNGTSLNGKESSLAGGLLDKMGIVDITPDKDSVKVRPASVTAANR